MIAISRPYPACVINDIEGVIMVVNKAIKKQTAFGLSTLQKSPCIKERERVKLAFILQFSDVCGGFFSNIPLMPRYIK